MGPARNIFRGLVTERGLKTTAPRTGFINAGFTGNRQQA